MRSQARRLYLALRRCFWKVCFGAGCGFPAQSAKMVLSATWENSTTGRGVYPRPVTRNLAEVEEATMDKGRAA